MMDDGYGMEKKVKEEDEKSSIMSNSKQENTTIKLFCIVLTHFDHILFNLKIIFVLIKGEYEIIVYMRGYDDIISELPLT